MDEFENACLYGNLDLVKELIGKGAVEWECGLYYACRGGNLNIINYLIEKGAVDLNWGLAGACYGGHLDIVNYMIDAGAANMNSGLYMACEGGHLDIVIQLLELGANKYPNFHLPNPTINLLRSNKQNLGGNEDTLLSIGIPPSVLEYSPAYLELNKQRKQSCISYLSKYLIYDLGKLIADYAYY